jgi:hypothetical protein
MVRTVMDELGLRPTLMLIRLYLKLQLFKAGIAFQVGFEAISTNGEKPWVARGISGLQKVDGTRFLAEQQAGIRQFKARGMAVLKRGLLGALHFLKHLMLNFCKRLIEPPPVDPA